MDFPVAVGYRTFQKVTPKVTIHYPFVYGLVNHQVEMQINKAIIDTLNNLMIELGFHDSYLQEMLGQFEIKTNERGIFSLSLNVYSFTGGAHGMTIIKSLSFDVATGHQYELNELFKADSDYVTKLSAIIQKKITDWETPLLEEFTDIRNDQDFYLADHSLVIYFQLYEITPYVAGFPYYPIPILDIQDIIKPEGPLEKLLPF
jgi:hypothetical protein